MNRDTPLAIIGFAVVVLGGAFVVLAVGKIAAAFLRVGQ